jgi:hypothetical protein
MAENTNVPFIEVIPLHAVLVLIDFTVFPVLRSTSVMNVVYVVCANPANVIVISPDGKEHRQLLSKADRLENPMALHYDRQTRQLLVANANTSAFILYIYFGKTCLVCEADQWFSQVHWLMPSKKMIATVH